jgi:hypothetical protein
MPAPREPHLAGDDRADAVELGEVRAGGLDEFGRANPGPVITALVAPLASAGPAVTTTTARLTPTASPPTATNLRSIAAAISGPH